MCSGDDDRAERTADYPAVERPARQVESGPAPGRIDPDQVEAMIDELFGATLDYVGLVSADGALSPELLKRVSSQPGDLAVARAYLRRRILAARSSATPQQALAIAELQLAWLTTAQEAGADACVEVTTANFGNDTPQMREDWRRFEQSVAMGLLQSGGFAAAPAPVDDTALPDWAFDAAAARYEVEPDELREWLDGDDSPSQCSAKIALLQAMLERRDDVTSAMLAAIWTGGIVTFRRA